MPAFGTDDANIFFVYAQNANAGEGWVYNPGGERVEGFSSWLWVAVCTLALRLQENPELLLFLASTIIVAAGLVAVVRRIESERVVPGAVILFLLWMAISPAYWLWSVVSLLETGLWSTVLLVGFVLASESDAGRGNRLQLSLVVTAVILTRPEGMVWGGLLAGLALLSRWMPRRLRWIDVVPMVVHVLVLGTVVGIRMAYFGHPLPNTYYAKMSPDLLQNLAGGFVYFVDLLRMNPGALIAFLCTLAGLRRLPAWWGRDPQAWGQLAVSLMLLAGWAIPVLEGGDHFAMHRLYQPLWPLMLLPVLYTARDFARSPRINRVMRLFTPALLTLLVGFGAVHWIAVGFRTVRVEFGVATRDRAMGALLNKTFIVHGERPNVASIAAGAIKFAYEGDVLDIIGLNHTGIAHADRTGDGPMGHGAFSKDVFLREESQIVIPRLAIDGRIEPFLKYDFAGSWYDQVLKGLTRDPRFIRRYVAVVVRGEPSGKPFAAYIDRAALEKWTQQGILVELARSPKT